MSPAPELDRLNSIADHSQYSAGINTARTAYSGRVFARHFKGARCLELGPAEGIMTPRLYDAFPDLTVVEGAAPFCESLRTRFPKATVIHSLFEDFTPSAPFDTIILGHVLEHVEYPTDLLRLAATWLAPAGVICTAVPNARSIHRQAAVILGLLATEHGLNPTDLHHGHRRVYDPEGFRAEFLAAGLSIDAFGGYWLKPLSNAQIERDWTPEMNQAFLQLGERYPDIAAEIYVIASRST